MSPAKVTSADPFIRAAKEPEIVDLPSARFLTVTGAGGPESDEFTRAVQALYSVAFGMKFARKKAGAPDYKVSPLEALWWASVPKERFDIQRTPRASWRWKAMIRVPDSVTEDEINAVKKAIVAKRGEESELSKDLPKVSLEDFAEGRVVQLLHIGPYATEPASLEKMHALMEASNMSPHGYHHEVYLSDPRRSKPEKRRTILRQPVT